MRHALIYVLMNWKKHVPGAMGVDPRSSARWFDGWKTEILPRVAPEVENPVKSPFTWLASTGWRRHGLIDLHDEPASDPRRARSHRASHDDGRKEAST
jgi:hypothetical protein